VSKPDDGFVDLAIGRTAAPMLRIEAQQ